MRRYLTFAVGFAAFFILSASVSAAPVLKQPVSKQINSRSVHSGRALKPDPKIIVPNYKVAYLIDQNKIRGRK